MYLFASASRFCLFVLSMMVQQLVVALMLSHERGCSCPSYSTILYPSLSTTLKISHIHNIHAHIQKPIDGHIQEIFWLSLNKFHSCLGYHNTKLKRINDPNCVSGR